MIAALRGVGMPLARIRVVGDLPARAAAVEVRSWWRQVEADTLARSEQVHLLIDDLVTEERTMTTGIDLPRLDHGICTDRGLVRESNEDVAFAGARLFVVADGFGAQGTGRTAGQVALDALSPLDSPDAGDDLAGALARARDALAADPVWKGTGTTLTAVLWSGTGYAVAHVGDSRLYLLRGGELTVITHDHTYVQSLVEDGKLTPEEAAVHPERATLLRGSPPTRRSRTCICATRSRATATCSARTGCTPSSATTSARGADRPGRRVPDRRPARRGRSGGGSAGQRRLRRDRRGGVSLDSGRWTPAPTRSPRCTFRAHRC